MSKKKSKKRSQNKNVQRKQSGKPHTSKNSAKQNNKQNTDGNRNGKDAAIQKKDSVKSQINSTVKEDVVQDIKHESQLKSVMKTMERLNVDNRAKNLNNGSKDPDEHVNKPDKSMNKSIDDSVRKLDESVEKVENSSEALMDFSKIDDEYKGELRRKLTPKERFFRTCEKFGDLFLLNILFTLTSLPIVTIGASFTAMYTVTFKMVRNEDIPVKDGYFKAFKRNFKQSTQIWVGLMVVIYLVYLQLKKIMEMTGGAVDFLIMAVGFELLLMSFIVPLLFPMIARYENTNYNMIKNSLLASLMHLGTWATVFFLWTIPVVLYYLKQNLFFYTWYLWFVFLASFVAYTCSYRLRTMFDKIEKDPLEDLKENNEISKTENGETSS